MLPPQKSPYGEYREWKRKPPHCSLIFVLRQGILQLWWLWLVRDVGVHDCFWIMIFLCESLPRFLLCRANKRCWMQAGKVCCNDSNPSKWPGLTPTLAHQKQSCSSLICLPQSCNTRSQGSSFIDFGAWLTDAGV